MTPSQSVGSVNIIAQRTNDPFYVCSVGAPTDEGISEQRRGSGYMYSRRAYAVQIYRPRASGIHIIP